MAGQPGLPPFPTWPPPNGGAPFNARPELGPIAGTPPPGTTFPAGSFIGGGGVFVSLTASSIVQTMDLNLNRKLN